MVSDEAVARRISELMLRVGRELDESVLEVMGACPEGEFAAYRRGVGRVLGEMWTEVMKPLYERHPGLKPAGLE